MKEKSTKKPQFVPEMKILDYFFLFFFFFFFFFLQDNLHKYNNKERVIFAHVHWISHTFLSSIYCMQRKRERDRERERERKREARQGGKEREKKISSKFPFIFFFFLLNLSQLYIMWKNIEKALKYFTHCYGRWLIVPVGRDLCPAKANILLLLISSKVAASRWEKNYCPQ